MYDIFEQSKSQCSSLRFSVRASKNSRLWFKNAQISWSKNMVKFNLHIYFYFIQVYIVYFWVNDDDGNNNSNNDIIITPLIITVLIDDDIKCDLREKNGRSLKYDAFQDIIDE